MTQAVPHSTEYEGVTLGSNIATASELACDDQFALLLRLWDHVHDVHSVSYVYTLVILYMTILCK